MGGVHGNCRVGSKWQPIEYAVAGTGGDRWSAHLDSLGLLEQLLA